MIFCLVGSSVAYLTPTCGQYQEKPEHDFALNSKKVNEYNSDTCRHMRIVVVSGVVLTRFHCTKAGANHGSKEARLFRTIARNFKSGILYADTAERM